MAGPNYMPTSLTKESFDRMTTGAGAAYIDLPIEKGVRMYADELAIIMEELFNNDMCLGSTNGGITPDFGYETTSIDVDGKTFEFVGSKTVTETNGSVEMSLKETSAKTFRYALSTSRYDDESDELIIQRSIPDDAYIPDLWVIAALRNGGYVGFNFENALAEGTSGSTSDDQPAEWSVTFTAYARELVDSQTAPFRIKWFPTRTEDNKESGNETSENEDNSPEV